MEPAAAGHACDFRPLDCDCLLQIVHALFMFFAQFLAQFGVGMSLLFFVGAGLQRRHFAGCAIGIHGHHGEKATVGVRGNALVNVLGNHFVSLGLVLLGQQEEL